MSDTLIISIVLASSAGIFVLCALIYWIFIFKKVRAKRKEILDNQFKIEKEIENNKGEIAMRSREDFGEPLVDLQNDLGKTISHEIVEFCINSCIRNEFKNILLIGNVEPYEAITISNKSSCVVNVRKNEFDKEKYDEIKKSRSIVRHNINILEDINDAQFDSIMCLNSTNNFDQLFLKNEKFLREKGMFIFANTKANKSSQKALVREVEWLKYRYDILNWYTGFVTIVKDFN